MPWLSNKRFLDIELKLGKLSTLYKSLQKGPQYFEQPCGFGAG